MSKVTAVKVVVSRKEVIEWLGEIEPETMRSLEPGEYKVSICQYGLGGDEYSVDVYPEKGE